MSQSSSKTFAILLSVLGLTGCLTAVAVCCAGAAIVYPRLAATSIPPALEITPEPSATFQPTITPGGPTPNPADIGSAGIGDPYFPDMGNGGYDVLHYDIRLTVNMDARQISADTTIQARATKPLAQFDLDLEGLDVAGVLVDGQEAQFTNAGGELVVTPAQELASGAEFTSEVKYSGRPGGKPIFSFSSYLDGWNFYPGGVVVAGEPTGAQTWFPSNNHPLDKATYTIAVTVAKPYLVAANGVLTGVEDAGNDSQTFTWEMDQAMASYLATVDIAKFTEVDATSAGGVPIRSFLDPRLSQPDFQAVNVIPRAVDYFASLFGPFPFSACGVVAHDIDLGFALEDQTLVVLGSAYNEITIVHELSHQWFGDSVSLKRWKDIWLNEGFASYAEDLWIEHTQGRAAADDDLSQRYQDMRKSGSDNLAIGDPGPDNLFDWAVYDRGALTLHALRLKIGDDAFFRTMQTYSERFAGVNAGTEDFQAVAEETSGQSLGDFFDAWLYQTALPDIPEMGLSAASGGS